MSTATTAACEDMMKPAPSYPRPLEGLSFALMDLRAAMAWAAARPDVRLSVMTDHPDVPEAIEICPPGSLTPRWCIRRDHTGRLRVDDWSKAEFDLPYSTLTKALSFISTTLADAPRR
jgi:hypothetical protein